MTKLFNGLDPFTTITVDDSKPMNYYIDKFIENKSKSVNKKILKRFNLSP